MKQALLLGLAGLMAAGITSSALFPASAESSAEAGGSETSTSSVDPTVLKEQVWEALGDLYSSSNYTMEWEYLGHTYQDVVNPRYSYNGSSMSAYVELPSYDGAYERIAYSAVIRQKVDGTKDIDLGSAINSSEVRTLGGDSTLGDYTIYNVIDAGEIPAPLESIEIYDPLSKTNGLGHSYWGASITSDSIVDLGSGLVGVVSARYAQRANAGIYFTMCARLGFYTSTATRNGLLWTGRFASYGNAYNGTGPAAIAFDFDDEGNLRASAVMTASDGTYYIPDFGVGTFKNVGSTVDEDFEKFVDEGIGNISKISLSRSEALSVVGSTYSAATTTTLCTDLFGEVASTDLGTTYRDYDGNYLHIYSSANPDGNLFKRSTSGSADYVYLTGANEAGTLDNGEVWLDNLFAYSWMEPGAWRYVASSDSYRYFGYQPRFVYWALTGNDVPGYQNNYDLGILSLDLKLTDGKVSSLSLRTGEGLVRSTTGPAYIYVTSETEISAETPQIDLPTPYERDDSYDEVKAAFDLNNDMTKTFQTVVVESVPASVERALHRYITYSPTLVLHDEIRNQVAATTREVYGYYLKEGVGIIPFEMDVDTEEVYAIGPTETDKSIADYWGTISASPDIMTYNSDKSGFAMKGEAHLLPSYFPTVSGSLRTEADSVSDIAISMGENNQIDEITYKAGAAIGSYGTGTMAGSIKYDWSATLPEGLLEKLAAMPEFVTPTSWTQSAGWNTTLERFMGNYLTALNTAAGTSYTVDDVPYMFDFDLENCGLTATSIYSTAYNSRSGYFYIRIAEVTTDIEQYLENYIAHLLGAGYQKFTGTDSNAYEMYGKDYIYVRPYNAASGRNNFCWLYFYLPGYGGTPAYPDVPAYEA